VVEFSPVQYNPVSKVLRVYNSIDVEIINDIKKTGINEIDESKVNLKMINDFNKRRFLNYSVAKDDYTPLEEEGTMLIICKDELVDDMNEYINWKNRKGIPVEIVPISDVGNSQSSIYNYVSDYYLSHPDLIYLLLVGDHADVNSYNAGSTGQEIKWSDSKYGLLAGTNDWYPDVFVGRFSASTTQNLQKIMDRNMEYEVSPLAGDWYNKAIGLGSDEGQGYGDDGEADWQHLRNIRTDLLNFGFTEVFEFYDGSHGGADASGSPSSNDIKNTVNDGITLFNFRLHIHFAHHVPYN
jgi:gingipain R